MESPKKLQDRRAQVLLSHSFKLEEQRKKKSTATEVRKLNLQSNTKATTLTPTLKKKPKCLSYESHWPGTENTLSGGNLRFKEQIKSKASSTKPKDTSNMNDTLLKKPTKLAPLDLPTEVKEEQHQKIMAMKDETPTDKQKLSNHIDRGTSVSIHGTQNKELLNKASLTEKRLPKIKDNRNSIKNDVSPNPTNCPLTLRNEEENTHEGPSIVSTLKLKSCPIPKKPANDIKINVPDAQNKGRFSLRYAKKQHEIQSKSKPLKAVGLEMELTKEEIAVEQKMKKN
ncbi:uncharacterized protein O3C94_006872 [Discoglossus pictus]